MFKAFPIALALLAVLPQAGLAARPHRSVVGARRIPSPVGPAGHMTLLHDHVHVMAAANRRALTWLRARF